MGLNLTCATLNALLKYPWLYTQGAKKWGAYHTEQSEFDWAREWNRGDSNRSAEAELMDWADDVAYSVHDVEDFYRAGLIPIDRMVIDTEERARFLGQATQRLSDNPIHAQFGPDALQQTFNSLADLFPLTELYSSKLRQRSLLRSWTAGLVARYINAISLVDPADNGGKRVRIRDNELMEVTMLKELTWHYVINNPALDTQQFGQRRVVRDMFAIYEAESRSAGNWRIFPESYQEQLRGITSDEERIRLVVDLISSMTEQQLLNMHRRLMGLSLGSVLDPILL